MPLVKDTIGLTSGNTLLFVGDSITDQQMFSNYLAAWFFLTYPSLALNIYCEGKVGSDLVDWWGAAPPLAQPTASFYEEVAYPFEPDVVFSMFGQNGGQTPAQHIATYEDLWTDWVSGVSASKLVMLGQHPNQLATDNENAEGKADQEAIFAAATTGVFASDTFEYLGTQWLANSSNAIDIQQPSAEPFGGGYPEGTAGDTTHPGVSGHIAIAWAVLQGLGAETVVSAATINAATLTATAQNNCTVSNVTGNTSAITFDRLDNSLPWAIDEAGRANAIALIPAIEAWQDYSITVSGLDVGTYNIECDSVLIGTATHTELAAGWNMADLTAGPVFDQCQETLSNLRLFLGFNPTNGNIISGNGTVGSPDYGTMKNILRYQNIQYNTNLLRGTTYKDTITPYITQAATKLAAVRTSATPATRSYTITNQSPTPPDTLNKRTRVHIARIMAAIS